ncbi:MAG: hypothetical protein M1826_006100 [Phylliscum demangeonii]|nr:MAG: hypothetical protein M1826_006100 [Phylliscum demangeonii]
MIVNDKTKADAEPSPAGAITVVSDDGGAATTTKAERPAAEESSAQLSQRLRQLDDIHTRLRALRPTIPRMLAPLTTPFETPGQLYVAFGDAARAASADVASFVALLQTDAVADTLARAAASRRDRPHGIRAWLVNDWPEALEARGDARPVLGGRGGGGGGGADEGGAAVEKAEDDDDDGDEKIYDLTDREAVRLPGAAHLAFQIQARPARDRAEPGRNMTGFVVRCAGGSYLHASIRRCLARRTCVGGRREDLKSVLELLASYMNLTSTKCRRCRDVLDSRPQFPTARTRVTTRTTRTSAGAKDKMRSEWHAYHEDCIARGALLPI